MFFPTATCVLETDTKDNGMLNVDPSLYKLSKSLDGIGLDLRVYL